MAKTTLNPDGLPVPRGSYSLVNIAQPGRMVFIAGQTASDHEGKVIGAGDARAQTRFVLKPPAER
jgi:2-iminobutanoate/2-iminopropanoate deaminase